jgi:Kazal-type serine protease inhibitor domain
MRRFVFAVLAACGSSHAAIDAPPQPDAPIVIDAAPPIDAPLTGCGTNADCSAGELCQWAPQHACGHDQARGGCAQNDGQLCPDLAFWICGCDGQTYVNECIMHAQMVDVDYGGPCRPEGVFVACTTTDDCPTDLTFHQFCVDDPRDNCNPANGDTGCAGVCVHANQTCNDSLPCPPTGSTTDVDSPDTEACVPMIGVADGADPGACVYTTRNRCASQTDCGDGELCVPDFFACFPGSPCLGWCSRP